MNIYIYIHTEFVNYFVTPTNHLVAAENAVKI